MKDLRIKHLFLEAEPLQTCPDAPQATIPTGAGIPVPPETDGWHEGLIVEKTMLSGQYRLHCPKACGKSEVFDVSVFVGMNVVKCRQCGFLYLAKMAGDKYLWKAVPHE